MLHATVSVAKLSAHLTHYFGDFLHHAGKHSHSVAEQRAVGRIVNIALHHRGIDTEFAPLDDLLLLCNRYHTLMQFLDDFRPNCRPNRDIDLSSGTLPPPIRVNSRYTRLA